MMTQMGWVDILTMTKMNNEVREESPLNKGKNEQCRDATRQWTGNNSANKYYTKQPLNRAWRSAANLV